MYGRHLSTLARTEETIDEDNPLTIGTHPVGPDYFATMGIPVLRGRGLTWGDDAASLPVAVVDEVAADRLWPSRDPVGEQVHFADRWFTVVGVVGRVHQRTLSDDVEPEVYAPAFQLPYHPSPVRVTIRSSIPSQEVAAALRAAVWEADRTVPVPTIEAMEDRISAHLRSPRFVAVLSSAFSVSAVMLTLVAIFGLMSYWVTARTREIGLRMALGAQGGQVLWTVQRQCLRMVLVGLVTGLALAAGVSRLLSALLFGVPPLDPPTFALVAVGLGVAALLASIVPALRATRVEPTMALKWE
jgi:putative ABC transport system permease protein